MVLNPLKYRSCILSRGSHVEGVATSAGNMNSLKHGSMYWDEKDTLENRISLNKNPFDRDKILLFISNALYTICVTVEAQWL